MLVPHSWSFCKETAAAAAAAAAAAVAIVEGGPPNTITAAAAVAIVEGGPPNTITEHGHTLCCYPALAETSCSNRGDVHSCIGSCDVFL